MDDLEGMVGHQSCRCVSGNGYFSFAMPATDFLAQFGYKIKPRPGVMRKGLGLKI